MSKENNLNFLKIQTCVLKVNIDCDGCKKKVKKLLQKIDGVYTISIDAEQDKAIVSGNVDPSTLIKKLSKAGKYAELLPPKGSTNNNKNSSGGNFLNDQFQKLKLEGEKGQQKDNGKPQKGGGSSGGGKDQKGQQVLKNQKLPQLKDFNFPSQKDPKNVDFSPPEDFGDGSDFDFDDDGEFDDYDDDDFDDPDDMNSTGDDFDVKPVIDKKGGGGGGSGNNNGKKGGDNPKESKKGEKNNGKNNGGKKGGEKNDQGHPPPKKIMGQGFNGGLDMGKLNGPTGIPQAAAKQGMPAGTVAANPYQQQQQYMDMMRQQQQQQQQQQQMMMNNGMTVYGQPMGYIPAPPVYGEPYANFFSDENTTSGCSIM